MRGMGRRLSLTSFALTSFCALALTSCGTEPEGGVAFSLDDPQGILDTVVLDPAELRIVIFPEASVPPCDSATGRLSPTALRPLPEPSTVRDAAFPESVVDVTIPLTTLTGQSHSVPAGRYTILVRGRGEDTVTFELDQVIASGCVTDTIAAGGTKGVTITMREVTGTGTCGNSTVSPDEQCDDGNTNPGDGCSPTCQTEAFRVNLTDTNAVQQAASVAWGAGTGDAGRSVVAWQTDNSSVGLGMRFLSDRGNTLPLPLDRDLVADTRAGAKLDVAVAVGGGSVLLAYRNAYPNDASSDVRVRAFSLVAPTEGGTALTEATLATETGDGLTAGPASAGRQAAPAVAVLGDGTGLVVFENPTPASGLSGRIYEPGARAGAPAGPFELGAGSTGGRSPVVTAAGAGFVAAYLAGGSVFAQPISATGTAGAPVTIASTSTSGDAPLAIGALRSCGATGPCALIAWESGTGISGAVVGADGALIGATFDIASGAATGPSVAGGTDRFVITWTATDGVYARIFGTNGAPALNRERTTPRTDHAFLVGPSGSAASVSAGGAPSLFTPTTNYYLVVWNDPTVDPAGNIGGRLIPF
jgi:cysteine-rich repeat protein